MSTQDLQALEALLQRCFSITNEDRRQAETQLNDLAKRVEAIPLFLALIRGSTEPGVRQLASVVLRKKIPKLWKSLSPDIQEQTKQALLESIVQETVAIVRRASADLVAVIAKHTVPQNQWPGLLDFLLQCSRSPNEVHREVAIVVFTAITETIGDHMRHSLQALKEVVVGGLRDPVLSIKIHSLRAVSAFASEVNGEDATEVSLLADLVPHVVDVARACLSDAAHEEEAAVAFEILMEVLEMPVPAFQGLVAPVVAFSLEVALNRSLELGTRETALQPICWLAQYKPKQLQASPALVHAALDGILTLVAEGEPEDHDNDDQLSANKFGCQALDMLACNLKAKHVYPRVSHFAKMAIVSPNADARAGAIDAIGVTAEGCSEQMRKHVKSLLNEVVMPAARDPVAGVRASAAFCLTQMAEYMCDRIADRHATVMPAAIALLSDPSPEVQERACGLVDSMCEVLEDSAEPYLDQIMQALLHLMQGGKVEVQEMALVALTTVAAISGAAFARYAPHTLPLLHHFLAASSDQHLTARARATECLGLICTALGAEAAENIARDYMPLALRGMDLEYPELRECTFGFFTELAKALGARIAPYLETATRFAIESLEKQEGATVEKDGERFGNISSEDDEDDPSGGGKTLEFHSGIIEEKCAAAQCLGFLAKNAGPAFGPYLEKTSTLLFDCSDSWDEDLRAVSYDAIVDLIRCVFLVFEAQPDSPLRAAALSRAAERLLTALDSDDDASAVASAIEGLGSLLKLAGPEACSPWLGRLFEEIEKILKGEALCQAAADSEEEGEEDGEDEAEEDAEALLHAAAEILGTFAEKLTPPVYMALPQANAHMKALLGRLRPSQPASTRWTASGCLAELALKLGPSIAPYLEAAVTLIIKEIRSDDDANQQNAAYCLGALFQACPQPLAPEASRALQALHPMFGEEVSPSARDNASAAVCRILHYAGGSLPLGPVLSALLPHLPLEDDLNESDAVAQCLTHVLVHRGPEIPDQVPGVLQVLGAMAAHAKVPAEVKDLVGRALVEFGLRYAGAGAMEALRSCLPAEVLGPVEQHIQATRQQG